MTGILYQRDPLQPAGTVDVNTALVGAPVMQGLVDVRESYGDWTVYAARTQTGAAGTVPSQCLVKIIAGHDRAAVDVQVLPELIITLQSLRTWLVYHIVASTVRLDLTITHLAGAKPQVDRISAWVAPGRPVLSPVVHTLVGTLQNRIPTFSSSLRFTKDLLAPSTLTWRDAVGNTVATSDLTVSVAGEVASFDIPVPLGAVTVEPNIVGVTSGPNLSAAWMVYA